MSALRWSDGKAKCPRCESTNAGFLSTRRLWKCRECSKQFSVKAGTVFEDSPLGLDKWLPAVWLIVNAKNGISSCEIGRALKVTQKTAWSMLHRIRLAMQNGTIEKMTGTVEVDETYIGGKAANMHAHKRVQRIKGRGMTGKDVVVGLLERGGEKQASRVHHKVLKSADKASLHGEIHRNVEAASNVYTDCLPAYCGKVFGLFDVPFKPGLELLEFRQRPATSVHFQVEAVRQAVLAHRQELAKDGGRVVVDCETRPPARAALLAKFAKFVVDAAQHHQHGADRRVPGPGL